MALNDVDDELLVEVSGLDSVSFEQAVQYAIENAFATTEDMHHVAVPLTVSSSSHISVSDGPAVADDGSAVVDAVVNFGLVDAVDQPASVIEHITIHSDIGPSASYVGSCFSQEPESIEDIDLAIAEAEVKVLKAKRSLALRSKASSNASLSSLRVDPKRTRQAGPSSSASLLIWAGGHGNGQPRFSRR